MVPPIENAHVDADSTLPMQLEGQRDDVLFGAERVIDIQKLSKVYVLPGSGIQVWALRGVDLVIERGDYVAICGMSGSGKSTMMNIIGCLDRPTAGRYMLEGVDVSNRSDNELSEIRGTQLGFVFQSFNLISQLTVQENLEVPMFYRGLSPAERRARAEALARSVQIQDRLHHRPAELSGGQQQRVAIARALANDPVFILADEPTGNLDTRTGEAILEVFEQLNQAGKTIVMVTHEPAVAGRCRRMVTIRDGSIVDDVRMR